MRYMLDELTWLRVVRTSGYSPATWAKTSSHSSITLARALDLVTQCTYRRRSRRLASSKA